jgi:hypothetical protein
MYNGRADACVTIHRITCEVSKVEEACRYYDFGRHCPIGDPDKCNLYISLLLANTACSIRREQDGCDYLKQHGLVSTP